MWSRIWRVLLLGVVLSCGGGGQDATSPVPPGGSSQPPAPTIRITPPGSSALTVGATLQLAATITGASVATWSSSNVTVASVGSDGKVLGLAPGDVTISAVAGSASDNVALRVVTASTASQSISTAGGTLTAAGGAVRLTVPAGATTASTTITVTVNDTSQTDRTRATTTIEMLPAGSTFAKPLQLDLKRPASSAPAQLFWWNPASQRLEWLPSGRDATSNVLSGAVTHFSKFIATAALLPSGSYTYFVNSTGAPSTVAADMKAAAIRGLRQWLWYLKQQPKPGIAFSEATSEASADIIIQFAPLSPVQLLGTFQRDCPGYNCDNPLPRRIILNSAATWSTATQGFVPNSAELDYTVAHEFGHAIGLSHYRWVRCDFLAGLPLMSAEPDCFSPITGGVMGKWSAATQSSAQPLAQSDLQGLDDLYGSSLASRAFKEVRYTTEPPAAATAGATVMARLNTVDAAGQPIGGVMLSYSVFSPSGTSYKDGLVQTGDDGGADIGFTLSTAVGRHRLIVTSGKGGLFTRNIDVTAAVVSPSASQSTLALSANSVAANGSLTAIVSVKDASGATLASATASSFTATATGGTLGYWTCSNGVCTATYTAPPSAGNATISATIGGTNISGSPATVTITGTGGTGLTCTGTPRLGCGLALDQFSLIPAGTFQMGSTTGGSDERPVHSVTISRSFYMQKTEVTQGQWRAVMGNNPSYFSTCGDTCPVETVSWNDIQTFLTTLNSQTPGVTYRLPTEAEWEYAARAGTTGETYGTLDAIAWHSGNSLSKTHAAAGKLANAWGLYDMIGNVWEWVNDWYGSYTSASVTDPIGPATGTYRVLRGGSWGGSSYGARAADRGNYTPSIRNGNVGFRLVRTP